MTYLLVIFWLGGASVTVVEPPTYKVSALKRCTRMAHSVRKHFNRKEIIRIKCVPEKIK